MEKSILVPQSLHDMVLSKSGGNPVPSVKGIVSDKRPYEAFNALKNVKNVVLTGHSLDDKSDGHLVSGEFMIFDKLLGVMTDLAWPTALQPNTTKPSTFSSESFGNKIESCLGDS